MDKMVIIPLSEYNEMKEKIANKNYCNQQEHKVEDSLFEEKLNKTIDSNLKLREENYSLEMKYQSLKNVNEDIFRKNQYLNKQSSELKSLIENLQRDIKRREELLCRFKKSIFYKMWILWNGEKK